MDAKKLNLIISDIVCEAKHTFVIELKDPNNKKLPEFTAGSHIELYLKNGMTRHYSLLNKTSERERYLIGVSLDANSRGGSKYIHNKLRVGDNITISAPRNNFPLLDAEEYCFIAGGIGITPILSMIHECIENGKKWRLYYTARNRQRAAFYETISQLENGIINFHFNDEKGECFLDVADIINSLSPSEHIYCCGPNPLMLAVRDEGVNIGDRVHFEWFNAPVQPAQISDNEDVDGFTVKLAKSGHSIQVKPCQSILEAFEENGIDVPFSCRAGICRACECKVLDGEPEHLDMILSDKEKETNSSMLICVSRAKSKMLELDV